MNAAKLPETTLQVHSWSLVMGVSNETSEDMVHMCSTCGVVKHDYRPLTASLYPRYFRSVDGNLVISHEEPICTTR